MKVTFVKEGTVNDFFKAIANGMVAKDTGGFYYRLSEGKLVESQDLENWSETNEFEFGTINGVWNIYREQKDLKIKKAVKEEKDTATRIRENILKLANSTVIKGFYSSGVSKRLKVSLEDVEIELQKMVEEGYIQKRHQLLCHNDNCLRVLDTKKDKSEFNKEYNCDFCGEEMEEIHDGYIQEIYTGIKK